MILDPIFAVIRHHAAANDAFKEANKALHEVTSKGVWVWLRGPEIPADLLERVTTASEEELQALRSLCDARPTTMEGAAAQISYLGKLLKERDLREW